MSDEPKTLEDLEKGLYILHVFAGKDGHYVDKKEGESLEQRIVRAVKESPNGDVRITPHWC